MTDNKIYTTIDKDNNELLTFRDYLLAKYELEDRLNAVMYVTEISDKILKPVQLEKTDTAHND